jgi:succinyl-diaminopimelate desuccinylase
MTKNSQNTSIVEHLEKLIEFQTYAGNMPQTDACFNYLQTILSETGMHVERHTSDGFPSLIATTKASSHPKVFLQAHLDVVPAKPAQFKLTEKSGKLYGRGSYDMKFAVACYIQLVIDLKAQLHNYDFGIMLSCDEEIGGENGVCYLLNKGYGAEVCILPDGGNDWKIETSCNAVWIARLVADGQSAHGSRPWEGRNAINNLVDGLNEIHSLFGELKPYKNSVTISKIHGGEAMNQVPDEAEAILDMRFINDREYTNLSKSIMRIAKSLNLNLETVAYVKARNVNVNQPEVKSFIKLAGKLLGKPIIKTHSFGASDACYFADHDIPTIVIRPIGDGAHSDHEWIEKDSLFTFYEVMKRYITETTKIN